MLAPASIVADPPTLSVTVTARSVPLAGWGTLEKVRTTGSGEALLPVNVRICLPVAAIVTV